MKHFMTATALLIWLMIGYMPVQAQMSNNIIASNDENQPENGTAKGLCFKGAPGTNCNSFMITEFGLLKDKNTDVARFLFEIGWMNNINKSYAAGGALSFSSQNTRWRALLIGIKPRLRIWLYRRLSLEIAPGILFYDYDNPMNKSGLQPQLPAFTGHVGLNLADWIMLALQYENIKLEDPYFLDQRWAISERRDAQWSIVTKFGSYTGAILGPVAVLASWVNSTSFGD